MRFVVGFLGCLLGLGGCAAEVATSLPDGPDGEPEQFAPGALASDTDLLVVMPDTQFYACAYPDVLEAQTRWIAAQNATGRLAGVLHTGDVVDSDLPEQWQVVRDAFRMFGDDVPYLVTSGNHDLGLGRGSLGMQYLPMGGRAFELRGGAVGYLQAGRGDNVFAVTMLGGQPWLLLGLEFGPRRAVVEWAAKVLKRHAELPAIVFTHAYLYGDGARYDRRRGGQEHHPDMYSITPEQGVADGEDLYRELVEPHENVRIVLSGHVIPDGLAHTATTRRSGSVVHEILANYQTCAYCPCEEAEGGGGYLRVLQLDELGTMHVRTYSPHREQWLDDPDNAFSFAVR